MQSHSDVVNLQFKNIEGTAKKIKNITKYEYDKMTNKSSFQIQMLNMF